MKNTEIIVWLILLLLTLAVFLLSPFADYIPLLLIFSGLKFLLVAFQFMGIRHAHGFWKTAVISIVVAVLLGVYVVYTRR